MINNQLLGPVVLDGRLTGARYVEFLENNLTDLLDDVPLDIRQNMYFQHDTVFAHFSVVINHLNNRFAGLAQVVSKIGHQGHQI